MKTAYAIAIGLTFVAAGAARADINYPEDTPSVSNTTREAVVADLHEAQRLGLMPVGDGDYPKVSNVASNKSRAEVIAELQEAQRLGLIGGGEGDSPVATPEQEKLIAAAGRRAGESAHVVAAGSPAADR